MPSSRPCQRFTSVQELARTIAPCSGSSADQLAWILPNDSAARSRARSSPPAREISNPPRRIQYSRRAPRRFGAVVDSCTRLGLGIAAGIVGVSITRRTNQEPVAPGMPAHSEPSAASAAEGSFRRHQMSGATRGEFQTFSAPMPPWFNPLRAPRLQPAAVADAASGPETRLESSRTVYVERGARPDQATPEPTGSIEHDPVLQYGPLLRMRRTPISFSETCMAALLGLECCCHGGLPADTARSSSDTERVTSQALFEHGRALLLKGDWTKPARRSSRAIGWLPASECCST